MKMNTKMFLCGIIVVVVMNLAKANQAGVLDDGTVLYKSEGNTSVSLVSYYLPSGMQITESTSPKGKQPHEAVFAIRSFLVNTGDKTVVVFLGTEANIGKGESPEMIVAGYGFDKDENLLNWNRRQRYEDFRPIRLAPGDCAALPEIFLSTKMEKTLRIIRIGYQNEFSTDDMPDLWRGELSVDMPVPPENPKKKAEGEEGNGSMPWAKPRGQAKGVMLYHLP